MKIAKLTPVFAMLLPLLLCFGCGDDKSNNGSDPIPTELVDTWWYESAIIDEDPVVSFSEVAWSETATSGSVAFTADGDWTASEYAESITPIFTQGGTFEVHGNTLDFRTTIRNGAPLDPVHEFEMDFDFSDNTLILTATGIIFEDTTVVVIIYSRED